jgi:hypothetical protein
MLDAADSNRHDRRIAALGGVHFPDEGNLQEHGAGYTLFWPQCHKTYEYSQENSQLKYMSQRMGELRIL